MITVHPARHLLRAKDLIDARYRDPLDVKTLARAAKLSPAHFSREFQREFGEPPHRYLLNRRLERAAAMLRTTDRSVADICLTSGSRASARSRRGSAACTGCPPTPYRARHPPAAYPRVRPYVCADGLQPPTIQHVWRRQASAAG